jgi:Protein of unknown function (DUF3089)
MKRHSIGLLLSLVGAAAAAAGTPPAPDYSQPSAWAAFAGRPSRVDDVPDGVPGPTGAASTAVFFIHPTTYLAPVMQNAAFDAGGEIGARVDDVVLRLQASVFNGCCRIYAPRYRQASLKAITTNSAAGYAADDLAYGDVTRAFVEFLRLNPDGPFILASHSQGSIHALRLLQEKIAGTILQTRMIAAYAIGVAMPRRITQLGLPVCTTADATGCLITWNSVRQGYVDRRRLEESVIWWQGSYQPIAGWPILCSNPLDWKVDSAAPPSANLGAVHGAGRFAALPAPIPMVTGAVCESGLLGVQIPVGEKRHFSDALTLVGIYHDLDYGLFYMNIRENVAIRIRAWRTLHL